MKWSAVSAQQKAGIGTAARARKAAALAGISLVHQQALTDDLQVLESPQELRGTMLAAVIERLEADGTIEYAAPDLRRRRHALTSDPLLSEQWYLLSSQPAATRTELAWDTTQGNAAVVAVLDTGVRFDHPDLGRIETGGKLLAGYDFVSNIAVANDGNGRDADPADPGDWVSSSDLSQTVFADCKEEFSSWHGTRVAGLIGALTDNATGVAGAGWTTRVLPVRVLGKCGGYDSDIIAGMRWAAGLSVVNAPLNPNPAKIINLSLGGEGLCTAAYQDAVDEIAARGILVVASAGNDGGPVDAPANCAGVLGVAGLRHAGTKVGFSNLGSEIGIGAPGGNCVNTGSGQPCMFSIIVAKNTGKTTPETSTYTDEIDYNIGTSFSAPLAAAAAALMNSVNAALTPAQLITLIKSSSTAFPASAAPTCHVPASASDLQDVECGCTVDTCGAGMLNTGAAVAAALRPYGVLSIAGTITSGGSITASAAGSFVANGRSVTGYEWTVINLTGAAPVLMSPTQAQTSVQITGASQFTLRLTVTDDTGAQDVKEIALVTPVTSASPPVTPKTGGGGGQVGWELLIAGFLLGVRRRNGSSPLSNL